MNKRAQSPGQQTGFGVVEALVALLVVSVGVLGIASLQLTGMQHSSGGFNRSKALVFAQSMTTRIRIYKVGANTQAYANFTSTDIACNSTPVPYCQARPGVTAALCTPDELAVFDTFSVSCGDSGSNGAVKGVIGSLPNGTLTTTCLATPCEPGSAHEVNVSWSERSSRTTTDEMDTKRVQIRFRPSNR